jgi:hypothetical protein
MRVRADVRVAEIGQEQGVKGFRPYGAGREDVPQIRRVSDAT